MWAEKPFGLQPSCLVSTLQSFLCRRLLPDCFVPVSRRPRSSHRFLRSTGYYSRWYYVTCTPRQQLVITDTVIGPRLHLFFCFALLRFVAYL